MNADKYTIPKTLIEEAVRISNMLDRGELHIPRMKALLAKVGNLGSPKLKRKEKVNKYAHIK